jgi:Uma2 family endonuclease
MSPVFIHELWKGQLRRLADHISFELQIDTVGLGSSTFSRQDLKIGLEPDECYYIRNWRVAQRMQRFDPMVHPPPDLVLKQANPLPS